MTWLLALLLCCHPHHPHHHTAIHRQPVTNTHVFCPRYATTSGPNTCTTTRGGERR